MDVLLRLEGSSHAGPPGIDPGVPQSTEPGLAHFNRTGERDLSSTDVQASYTVRDLSQQVCNEGCSFVQVVSFGYRAHVLDDTLYGAEVQSTWSAAQPFTQLATVFKPQASNGDTRVGYFGAFGWDHVDTGLIRLHSDTHVGSQLQIADEIASLLQTNGMQTAGQAVNDFGHSFDADLVSAVAGVQIAGELATISAVPEPASWALWSAALLAGAALKRRRL